MSRQHLNNFLAGLTLILAGAFYLARNMELFPEPTPQTWTLIFAGAGLYFVICYFIAGIQSWWWLFPAFISAGLAGTIWLSENTSNDALVAAPILSGIALPFLAIYLLDRKNWWALIPFYVMAVIVGIVLLADTLPGEFIATFVLWSIAFPFLVVYLTDRKRVWALIPAGILAAIGLIPLFTTMFTDEAMGGVVMLLIAVPFFIVYFISMKNWWALIPAGILASIGLGIFLVGLTNGEAARTGVMNGVMYVGWGITFGVLWLQRAVQPTGWAIYPAIGFVAAGVLAYFTRSDLQQFWPFFIILVGVFMVVGGFIRRK